MTPSLNANTISLKDVAAILRRRRRLILFTFALILGGVTFVTFALPKQYGTRMKVLVKNDRAEMIVSADHNTASDYRSETSEAQINSEIELLTSNNLFQQVVILCGLDGRRNGTDPVAVEKAMKRLQNDVKVSPARKADIIVVEYADTDPNRAVAVLSKLAELYLEEHLRVHGAPGTYNFFKSQAEHYHSQLENVEMKLARFRQNENIVILSEQKEVMLQKSVEAESALMEADVAIGEYTERIVAGIRKLDATHPRVVTQSRTLSNQYSVERFQTMLADLQNRRTQLLSKYRPDDRMVLEVDEEMADTRAALDRALQLKGTEEATDINPVHQSLEIDLAKQENELAGLKSRRETLARQARMYRQQMMRLADATSRFDDLVRAQKEAEDDYLLYEKKTEEARITESLDKQKIANVAIAETPIKPLEPAKPNVKLFLALGVILALVFSLGLAFAIEYFREIVEQPRELEHLTGLPVLASSYGD